MSACLWPRTAEACLAYYRSPDWLVADSPLVIIGEVEKVEKGRVPQIDPPLTVRLEGPRAPKPNATIATVRILRFLKGGYPEARLRLGSGPIGSCIPEEVHLSFQPGERLIFVLPSYPRGGQVALVWGRSVLPLTATSLIEARVARAIAYRSNYLSNLAKDKPKVYAAALQLAGQLQAASKQWPEDTRGARTEEPPKELAAAVEGIKTRLARVDVETLVAALAVDWLSDDGAIWWRREAWKKALEDLDSSRHKEVLAWGRDWIRRTLSDAAVEPKQIDAYVAAVRQVGLGFPPRPPGMSNDLIKHPDGALLTTDFILLYYSYDRGEMLREYAMGFDAEILKDLDLKRVKPLVESLYQSDDERLRWLAREAIGYSPSTECVDLVLSDLVVEGHCEAWQVLDHWQRPKQTAPRLAAMLDLAAKGYAPWEQRAMWGALRRGECFEDVCVARAMARLDQLEKPAVKTPPRDEGEADASDGSQSDSGELANALREYLAAAKTSRERDYVTRTAEEGRRWFAAVWSVLDFYTGIGTAMGYEPD